MFSLKMMRENFYHHWSWWLLLMTFALTFFSSDRSEVKNIYRVLVVLPVFLMLSSKVVKGLFAVNPMRWFAAITFYFSITLIWGAEFRSIDNYLLRIVSVWGLAFLLYYIHSYRPELFLQIDKVLVFFGLIWIVLVVSGWDNLWQANSPFDQNSVRRGVFNHHLQVGWMIAVLTLISLQRIFRENSKHFFWVVITAIYLIVLILSQARGGLLVFFVGLIACLFNHSRRLSWRLVLLTGLGGGAAVAAVFVIQPEILNSLVDRGTAYRLDVWQNWFSVWQVSRVKMLFGYGLGAPTENVVLHFTAAHFHNFYLNTLYYCGVIGFALVVGWLLSLVTLVFKRGALNSPWLPIIVGMLAGFLTDGDKLFNYPGAFVFCFILPVFCLSFEAEVLS